MDLRPWRSLEVRGRSELHNGGLRVLEEAWDDFLLEAFSCQGCSFSVLLGRLRLVREGLELCLCRSLEVGGSPESQNGGLRVLEEVLGWFLLDVFFCQSLLVFCVSGSSQVGSRRCGVAFLEVLGGQGKSRVLERLPESYGRGLDDDFRVEAFSCQVWLFSVPAVAVVPVVVCGG